MENFKSENREVEINDLIFTEIFKRGFEIKEGKRIWNISDSKLWYLSAKQSQGYLDITHTLEYEEGVVKKETKLLEQALPKIAKLFSERSFNLLDLGCGDGRKAILFIKKLSESAELRYCPIDISSYMVQKAAETIRSSGLSDKVLEMKWNVSDFENLNNVTPLFRSNDFNSHLLMLLGNTLGNFDIHTILHGIKQGMKKGDVLVIGNGVTEKNTDSSLIVEAYNNKAINEWLSQVPKSVGLKDSEIEFNTVFRNSRVEEFYKIKVNKTIRALGQEISFKEGDEILVAISNKYTPKTLQSEINFYFKENEVLLNEDNSYAVVIAKMD